MEKNKIMHVGDVYRDKRIIDKDGKPRQMIVTSVRIETNPITGKQEIEFTACPY